MLINQISWNRWKASVGVNDYRLGLTRLTPRIADELEALTGVIAAAWFAMQDEHDGWLTYTGRSPDFGRR